jgi:hypothetical protein
VIFTYVLAIYLSSTLSIILPQPLVLLRTISTGFILLCSYMDTNYIHYIHPHSSFLYAHHSPSDTHPRKDLFSLLILHIFKCILIVQGGFALVLEAYIYQAFLS